MDISGAFDNTLALKSSKWYHFKMGVWDFVLLKTTSNNEIKVQMMQLFQKTLDIHKIYSQDRKVMLHELANIVEILKKCVGWTLVHEEFLFEKAVSLIETKSMLIILNTLTRVNRINTKNIFVRILTIPQIWN